MGFVSRNTKTEEIIRLAIMMQNSYRGMSIKDIASSFECSTRTAERMKALMLDLFPNKIEEVINVGSREKKWRFKKGTVNFLITFSQDEIIFLQNFQNNLEIKNPILDDIIAKVKVLSCNKKVSLNERNIASIMEAEGYLVTNDKKNNNLNSKYLEIIRNALINSRKISFLYGSDSSNYQQVLAIPYGIKIAEKYYLVAYNDTIKGIRQFSFDKIKNLITLDESFERNLDFKLDKYKLNLDKNNSKVKKIILEFNKEEKEYVLDSSFGFKQKFELLDSGKIRVSYYSEVSDEICLELVKWSSKLKIIEPIELKVAYKKFLNAIIKNL